MKYWFIACLALCFSLVSAQISVRNDAYIFVKDQVLFSNDYVNIEESTSKIYLRDEAQLIQGSGTTGNSGVGELSVYQNSEVNQFAYHYWGSPVGGVLTNTTSNNAFRIGQIDDPLLGTTDPIDSNNSSFTTASNGTTSPSLTISTRWLWTYLTSDQYSDWVFAGDALDIAPGLGFTMKGMSDTSDTSGITPIEQTYDFRGKPNNGDITVTVADGLNTLVGNPYPSAIDSAAFLHDLDNVNEIVGTLFYWEQDTSIPSHVLADYIGGYHEFTINATGTMITNAPAQFWTYDGAGTPMFIPPGPPGGTKQAFRYIPIGQGFMVEGITGMTNTVSFKNSHRVYEKEAPSSSNFFRSENTFAENQGIQYQENGLSIVPIDFKRFRVNVDFTVNNAQFTRQLVLNFHDNATMGHDRGLELHRSGNLNSDAYFVQEEDIFSGLAYPFTESLTIPLVVDIEQQQPLRFRIFDIQNFEESQGIYIHDTYNDVYVNLRNQDYDLNIEPGNYSNRFEIVFTAQESLNLETYNSNTLIISQNNDLHQLSVRNPKALEVSSIEVYDVSGKRLLQNSYTNVSDRYEMSTSQLSDGVYIVNVLSNSNSAIKSQKIIVKN